MEMNEIPFTRLPTKLIFTLDSDLLKMLAILIQQESYWIEHKKIGKDGSFYKPIKEFADSFKEKFTRYSIDITNLTSRRIHTYYIQ